MRVGIATAILLVIHSPASANSIIVIEREAQIYARAIDAALSEAADKISACAASGGDLSACQCQNRDSLEQVQAALDRALERYPDWEGRDLYLPNLYLPKSGENISINLFLGPIADNLAAIDCR